jgi:ribonucleotide reductase alpha subunit
MVPLQRFRVRNSAGESEKVRFDKIGDQMRKFSEALTDSRTGAEIAPALEDIDGGAITLNILQSQQAAFASGEVTTELLDLLAIDVLVNHSLESDEFPQLAGRLLANRLHRTTPARFSEFVAARHAASPGRISARFAAVVAHFAEALDEIPVDARDFDTDFAAMRTVIGSYLHSEPPGTARPAADDRFGLQRGYMLSKHATRVVERPQHALLRAAVAVYLAQLEAAIALRPGGPDCDLPWPAAKCGEANAEAAAAGAAAIDEVRELYDVLSLKRGSLASPFIFNAGSSRARYASCILASSRDSLSSIKLTQTQCALAASGAAGIGHSWAGVRESGAAIASTGGYSTGVPSWIRGHAIERETVTQGHFRPGASAQYVPWHHPDFAHCMKMALHKGPLAARHVHAPDLTYAAIVDAVFFELADGGAECWPLPPNHPAVKASGVLRATDAAEFAAAFWLAQRGLDAAPPPGLKRVCPRRLYVDVIYEVIRERGFPYMWARDRANALSMLQHIASIEGSNLCIEITIPSIPPNPDQEGDLQPGALNRWGVPFADAAEWERERVGEIGVCVLASVNVAAHCAGAVLEARADFAAAARTAATLARALDTALDAMDFPALLAGAASSVQRHRAIAVGMCGYADAMQRCGLRYSSEPATRLGRAFALAVYLGATRESCARGARLGGFPSQTETPRGFPAPSLSGLVQPDLFVRGTDGACGFKAGWEELVAADAARFGVAGSAEALGPAQWGALRESFLAGHLRNAYTTACMPTASTAVMLRTSVGIDPRHSNIFMRKQQTSQAVVYNYTLTRAMRLAKCWSPELLAQIAAHGGSVLGAAAVPQALQEIFRTAAEQDPHYVVLHAAARQPGVSQGQSMNFNLPEPDAADLYALHRLAHAAGLPTLSYYVYSEGARAGLGWMREHPPQAGNEAASDEAAPARGPARSRADRRRVGGFLAGAPAAAPPPADAPASAPDVLESAPFVCPFVPGRAPLGCDGCSA